MKKNKAKIIAVIQARLGSKRLPKKALIKIHDRTLIEWIAHRLSFAREIDQVILATSDTAENKVLVDLAEKIKLPYFCGSETDLIQRLNGAAKKFRADAIVRITGDCPFVDPTLVDKLVKVYRDSNSNVEYVSNISPPTFPDGLDVEVISTNLLDRLDREVTDPLRREWLTTTILENPEKFNTINVFSEENLSHLRLTVDYPEDLVLVAEIFSRLRHHQPFFTLKDILKLFKENPSLPDINRKWVDTEIINNIRSKAFHDLKGKL